jgi:hypothetical protein
MMDGTLLVRVAEAFVDQAEIDAGALRLLYRINDLVHGQKIAPEMASPQA